jgi:DNA transformation protein
MRAPDEFSTYLLELLAPLGPVSARRMFGGVGLFHNGTRRTVFQGGRRQPASL